jgi:non-reducing end alpha-L-arabinofuranosidase
MLICRRAFRYGPLPTTSGYTPLYLEGGIILGVGGDNSKGSAESFFEGVMTTGVPSAAAENAVQANITSVGYSMSGGVGHTGPIVAGDNGAVASNGTIQIDGGCLDITGVQSANGALIEWWTCNGGTNQQWHLP